VDYLSRNSLLLQKGATWPMSPISMARKPADRAFMATSGDAPKANAYDFVNADALGGCCSMMATNWSRRAVRAIVRSIWAGRRIK
jgi:hypothetical protein